MAAHDVEHQPLGLGVLADGWVRVVAPNRELAKRLAAVVFGTSKSGAYRWALDYEEIDFLRGLGPGDHSDGEPLRIVWPDQRQLDAGRCDRRHPRDRRRRQQRRRHCIAAAARDLLEAIADKRDPEVPPAPSADRGAT